MFIATTVLAYCNLFMWFSVNFSVKWQEQSHWMRIVKYLTGVLWAAITSMSGREWHELIGMSGLKEKIWQKEAAWDQK